MTNILVFDSGIGGLSVVEHIRKLMPALHIDYVADDEFRPYGGKSEHELKARLPKLLRVLEIMLTPDLIVLACNTASTTALAEIRDLVQCPVIGVVPAIKPAANISKNIAVLGTPGTIRRKYVDELIKAHAKNTKVLLHGSTLLVEMAEQKLSGQKPDIAQIKSEIAPIIASKSDIIVLACTHFPIIAKELELALGTKRTLMDSGLAIAKRTKDVLQSLSPKQDKPDREQIFFSIGGINNRQFVCSYGFEKIIIL